MYESFFQLRQRPFAFAPRVDRYFPAPVIEGARQILARCIERAQGTGMLIGPSGCGKTLVCQLIAEQFRDTFAVAMLAGGHLRSRRALLQAVLFDLGLPYRGLEEEELYLSLAHFLTSADAPHGMLLILDEAHTYSVRLLEEARLLTNLMHRGQPCVRLLLAGGPLLEERFASPKLESFSQRVASRCYLGTLDLADTESYVTWQLKLAGGDGGRIFAPGALGAVYRASDGIPRLVNQVCDHALMLAFEAACPQLSAAGVEEAWADLQQLPAPWDEPRRGVESHEPNGAIEFGNLADEDDLSTGSTAVSWLAESPAHSTAAASDGFRPAGIIGPQGGDVLATPRNPFAEEFDEEEVVIDRYASLDAAGFRGHPQVHSSEGRILAALLEPFSRLPQPQLALVDASEPDETSAGSTESPAICDLTPWLVSVTLDTSAGTRPSGPPDQIRGVRADLAVAAIDRGTGLRIDPAQTFTTESRVGGAPTDEDQMIVEDDPLPEMVSRTAHLPGVRRQEYRQLFSKLRIASETSEQNLLQQRV